MIPDYRVEKFDYVSSVGTEKQWKLLAKTASVYHHDNLVHAHVVKAFLYDPDGKITVVTGNEAKYLMNQKDLEVFGNVVTTFPDGFELDSDYLRYKPNEKRILMPDQYHVKGFGKESSDKNISFESQGLDYAMAKSFIILPKAAQVKMARETKGIDGKSRDDTTTIISDRCEINRAKQVAHFTMYSSRPIGERFVHILQPTLFAKGRTADLNYGDSSEFLQYLIAYEDVLIKNIDPEKEGPLKYGTGGRADFDNHKDVVVLTEFPQVYQDSDTVTGDKILMHRDTDLVEIDNSNSFSQGEGN
jgi:LPS export ABC transporter protein LptC